MGYLYHALLFGGIQKMARHRLMYTTIFKRVLDIIRIKIGHLRGENRWESSGGVDLNELDIKGLKAAQRNELVVRRQNIAGICFGFWSF